MKKKLDKALQLQLVLGGAGLILNLAVVLLGHDESGLAKPWFLPGLLLPLVITAAILLPALTFGKWKAARKYLRVFTASLPTAAAMAIAAAAMLLSGILGLGESGDKLAVWKSITGILGGAALGLCAWFRFQGKRPVWLCWGVVAVHLTLVLLSNYQLWSRQVELNSYLPQLLTCVNLMLCAYQQSAADGGMGNLRSYVIISLINVALCPIAMIGSGSWLLFLTFWLYHTINLYSLNLKKSEGD